MTPLRLVLLEGALNSGRDTARLEHAAAARDMLPSETNPRPGSSLFHATDYVPDLYFCCPLPTAASQAENSELCDKKHIC